eukprot:761747-Hanusia_phi.AAC.3
MAVAGSKRKVHRPFPTRSSLLDLLLSTRRCPSPRARRAAASSCCAAPATSTARASSEPRTAPTSVAAREH